MSRDKRAVILAAGMGTRLRPITEQMPKCLTEVNGKPITWHALNALNDCGFEHVTIVVGFEGHAVMEAFGSRFGRMSVAYRYNERYARTNSMYSAWLARDVLEQGAWLIEGDVLFNPELVRRTLREAGDRSLWIVKHFGPDCDGSMSVADDDGRIVDLKIVREPLPSYPDNQYKSAGILCLRDDYGRHFSRWLDDEVARGNTNVYFDLVIADHLEDAPLHVHVPKGNAAWFEIDTIEDLKEAERRFQPRKYVIVVMDGAADHAIPELDGKTPFEAADMPGVHRIAAEGRTGLIQTMYQGVPIDSITGNMGILGFYPPRYYPVGRASFEAMAQDIFLDEDDIAFRCNLISLDANDRIADFTAGQIPTEVGAQLINRLRLAGDDIEIYSGQSYRNTLVVRNAGCLAHDLVGHAPHQNLGNPIEGIMLSGKGEAAERLAVRLNALMRESRGQVAEANRDLGTDAHMLWLWSPSSYPKMPSFVERFGIRGAIVAGLDFMRGIGEATGMHTKEIHGATGYLNTNFREKLKYAKNFLLHNDFVFVHINAPDEEAHAGSAPNKVRAIELIDSEIVTPLLDHLERRYPGNFRIAVLPDHYTCLADSQHLDIPVPYAMYGAGIVPDTVERYTEAAVAKVHKDVIQSTHLLELLISEGEIGSGDGR